MERKRLNQMNTPTPTHTPTHTPRTECQRGDIDCSAHQRISTLERELAEAQRERDAWRECAEKSRELHALVAYTKLKEASK